MKRRHKKKVLISILGLTVVSFICCLVYKPKVDDGLLTDYLMADFTGDSEEELLVISKKYGKEKENIIKLINIETNDIIWKQSFQPKHIHTRFMEPCIVDSFLVLKKTFTKNDSINNRQFKCLNLVGLNANTGQTLWEKQISNGDTLDYETKLLENNGQLLLCFVRLHKREKFNYLIKIKPIKGEILLEKSIPSDFNYIPSFIGKNRIIYHDDGEQIFYLNTSSGDTNYILPSKHNFFREHFIADDKTFHYMTYSDIFKYDSTEHFLKEYNAYNSAERDSVFDFAQSAIYDGRLVFLNTYFRIRNNSNYIIYAIPFEDNKNGYEFGLDTNFYIATSFYNSTSHINYGVEGKNVFKNRYMPFQLYGYSNSKEFQDSLNKINPSQLMIFDLEKGKPVWESRITNNVILSNYWAVEDYIYMTYEIRNNKTTEWVRIMFDSRNGKFHRAIKFNLIPQDYFENKISNKHICFTNKEIIWCLSIPDLELKYSTGKIGIQDAKTILEKVWGQMTWTENN